jgi:Zn-dependent peptidase ImmA (M78 family)
MTIEGMPGSVTDPRAGELLERYRELFGGPGLPVPVESIAEDLLGLRVGEADTLDCSGLLIPARREIWVNAVEAAQSPGRRRFTIAHELGHWVCQVLEGHTAPIYCRAVEPANGGHPPEEREANVFAAELLMPEPAVRSAFSPADSVEAMAARFDVSKEAMHWRLYNFGLVEERPA